MVVFLKNEKESGTNFGFGQTPCRFEFCFHMNEYFSVSAVSLLPVEWFPSCQYILCKVNTYIINCA